MAQHARARPPRVSVAGGGAPPPSGPLGGLLPPGGGLFRMCSNETSKRNRASQVAPSPGTDGGPRRSRTGDETDGPRRSAKNEPPAPPAAAPDGGTDRPHASSGSA
eukprot:1895506-Prymnesium_polylepis.1